MTAVEQARGLVQSGSLQSAIDCVTQGVKARPGDATLRTFLFELLCFAGDWDRAEKQLDVIGHQDVKAAIGVLTYRNLIAGERARRRVFEQGVQPHFFLEPPPYVDVQVRALLEWSQGLKDAATNSLNHAVSQWPKVRGCLNGRGFEDLRDCDDTVGPVLEVLVRDQYAWLPLEQVREIEVEAPQRLRDTLWLEARMVTIDGTTGQVFLPAVYVHSCGQSDERLKLGRMTDWQPIGDRYCQGVGQRMFLADSVEEPVLGIRKIQIEDVVRMQGTSRR